MNELIRHMLKEKVSDRCDINQIFYVYTEINNEARKMMSKEDYEIDFSLDVIKGGKHYSIRRLE